MRIGLIGVGQAGGKITDTLLEYDLNLGSNFIKDCVAVNTARQDLNGLSNIPDDSEHRILIGESEVKGNGVGADNKKGRDVMRKDVDEVIDVVDKMPSHDLDAFVIVASLGGGTGSGGMPVLADEMKKMYSEPVYGLGILPSENEGQIYTVNAARSLQSCVDKTDNLMIFDNNAWSRGRGSLESWYDDLNREIASRFGTLFASGQIKDDSVVGESVVDASEIINTLDCGGITSIGQSKSRLDEDTVNPGLLTKLRGGVEVDEAQATMQIKSLVEKSLAGQLTLPANIDSTERGLIIIAGPPSHMTRKGMEKGRSLVEEKTQSMEVRGGDYPLPKTPELSATVVLSGLHDIPRVRELQEVAIEADNKITKIRENREEKLENLLHNEDTDNIDNLLDL